MSVCNRKATMDSPRLVALVVEVRDEPVTKGPCEVENDLTSVIEPTRDEKESAECYERVSSPRTHPSVCVGVCGCVCGG
jgi:hypothetical protein